VSQHPSSKPWATIYAERIESARAARKDRNPNQNGGSGAKTL